MCMIVFCSNGDKIATKLICYTRSSSLVHHLPTVHPKPTDSTTPEDQTTILYIEAVIYHKVFITVFELFDLHVCLHECIG